MINNLMTKLINQNHDQRHKYHHLTKTLHLGTIAQVVETSVTNNSLSEDYSHLDDHTRQTTVILLGSNIYPEELSSNMTAMTCKQSVVEFLGHQSLTAVNDQLFPMEYSS